MTAATRQVWVDQAEKIATIIRENEQLRVGVVTDDPHVRSPYLTVRHTSATYPCDTVWVDEDGFTWGGNFQHRLDGATPLAEVATAVLASLPPRGERER